MYISRYADAVFFFFKPNHSGLKKTLAVDFLATPAIDFWHLNNTPNKTGLFSKSLLLFLEIV